MNSRADEAPWRLRVDPALALIHTVWQGPVSFAHANDMMRAIVRDRHFDPSMRWLSDARAAVGTMSAPEIRTLAHNIPFGPDSRSALVVGTEVDFGQQRMFASLVHDPGEIRIFRDLDDARLWLGLTPEQARFD